MRTQFATLELTCPPISVSDADLNEQISKEIDTSVKFAMSQSKLYMIGKKRPASINLIKREETKIFISITCDDITCDGSFDMMSALIYLKKDKVKEEDVIKLSLSQNMLQIFVGKECLCFTVEALCQCKAKNVEFLSGFENYKDFSKYELLYVGIATKQNTWDRVVKKAHKAKEKILTREETLSESSKISDEIYIFSFDIKLQQISTCSDNVEDFIHFMSRGQSEYNILKEKTIKDAEKAFASMLKTKYNEIQFSDYPFSKDGLFDENLDSYAFTIDEDLYFFTEHDNIQGAYDIYGPKKEYSSIIVDNRKNSDKVFIVRGKNA